MSNIIIIVSVAVVILIIVIALLIMMVKSNKSKKAPDASILDVQNIGVSTNDHEFSYGYEKEETIVMQPITENSVVESNNSNNTTIDEDSKVLNTTTKDASQLGDEKELINNQDNEQVETLEIDTLGQEETIK